MYVQDHTRQDHHNNKTVMTLKGTSFLKSYPDMDLEDERVICLLQTEPEVTDSVAGGRNAIVLTQATNKWKATNKWEAQLRQNICLTSIGKNVEEKELPYHNWHKSLVHQNYSFTTCQTIVCAGVCVEAFKELEKEFLELLAGVGGMSENMILTQKLKYFVKNMKNTLNISLIL